MIIQLVGAFIGSLGFGIVVKIKGKQILYAGIGGMITWYIYLMSYNAVESYFIANFIASVFVGFFAEVMARVNKTPTTIFLTAAAIPLFPGGRLYYAMYGLVTENNQLFVQSATTAATIAIAISIGFMSVTVCMKYVNKFIRLRQTQMEKKVKDTIDK